MTDSGKSKNDPPLENSIPAGAVPLESILCTEELHRRPSRPPDYEKENCALAKLVSGLADSPSTILQTLAETILDITQCDSAGLSLLTRDGKTPDACGNRFYWPAIAGMWNHHVGGGTPRNFGPCGDVLDQNRSLLFKHFERRYSYLRPVIPPAEECLLVPFYIAGKAVGTIWAIMHSDRRTFDAEDDRVMSVLGQFASLVYQTLASIEDLKLQMAAREKAEAAVRELANGLETQVRVRTQDLERSTRDLLDTNEALEREIAERKRAKEALQVRELNLRLLVDSIPAPVAVMTPSGEVESVNKPNLEYFGKTFEDLKKWGTSDAVHPDDLPHAIEVWMEAIQTGQPYDVKQRLRRFDGVYRWFGVHGFPLRDPDGRILNWCVLLTDIDDRERAEQALRVVVETATDAVVSADESGAIQFANPATTRVFGYDPAELIGKPLTVLMPEFMRKLHEAGFKRYLATRERHINWQGTELTGLRKNGQEFPVEISFGELSKDGHRVFTGFIRDISERKQAEEIQKQAQKAIQTAQAELARVSRLTTMGELAASIAHEVNQPLTAVNNNSNACLRLLANQSLQPDVLRRALEEIVADGTRASAIIARIRAFIKKAPVEKSRLDVNEVIGEVLAMMGHGFEENGISLQSDLAQALPPVLGDRVQVQQVL